MTDKQPLLNIIATSQPWLPARLAELYDLRTEPGPGIRAVATDGTVGMSAAMMDALPDLEMVAVHAVGYDKVDLAHAATRGIRVTNTPDVLTEDVADLAIGLMLAVGRRIPAHDAYVRAGRWAREGYPPLTHTVSGRRIGILGLGRIGHAIALRAAPFAGDLAYFSRQPKADTPWRHVGDPVALAAQVDVLIVAVAGGPDTAGLVDKAVIEALGADGTLINIARGSVVDQPALISALQDGRLGAAGLDVFADEPHVPDALIALENVVLLPHQGSATEETRRAMAQLVLDNLAAFFAGKPLLTPVG
jgi:hydroxypyruvate reductase